MKQYVIDELRPVDHQKIKSYLDDHFGPPRIGGIYWIPLHNDILSDLQRDHADCQPHYFAVALASRKVSFELLVRSEKRIRCSCIAYANDVQFSWLIQVADAILERLGITV